MTEILPGLTVFFISGPARSGKDTVATLIRECAEFYGAYGAHKSAITPINDILVQFGWDTYTKDAIYRAAAASMLDFLIKYQEIDSPMHPVNKVVDSIFDIYVRVGPFGHLVITIQTRQPYLIGKFTERISSGFLRRIPASKNLHPDCDPTLRFHSVYVEGNDEFSKRETFNNSGDFSVFDCKGLADHVIQNVGQIRGSSPDSLENKVHSMFRNAMKFSRAAI